MRSDYPPLNIKPVFPGLGKIIIIIIIININIIIIVFIIIVIIIELTHSQTIQENTVGIEPQPVALDFKNFSQYSSHSK